MATAIMRRLTPEEKIQPRDAEGRPSGESVAEFIRPNDRLTSLERLEIYNRQYWFRLIDCLIDDFPGLRAVIGDRKFYPLILSYLEAHPSTSPLLGDLGKNLAAFIAKNRRLTAPHTKIAVEATRLEWAQIVAFDRESRPAIKSADITSKPPEELFFRLQPCITLLDLAYPVNETVLRLLSKDRSLRSESSNAVAGPHTTRKAALAGRIARRRTRLVVHRHDNSVYFKSLTAPQFFLLKKLNDGLSLALACGQLIDSFPRTKPADVQAWFSNWSSLGFLVRH